MPKPFLAIQDFQVQKETGQNSGLSCMLEDIEFQTPVTFTAIIGFISCVYQQNQILIRIWTWNQKPWETKIHLFLLDRETRADWG
jgi:hypothetical protein